MADVDKILRLVAEGALSAEEADEILSALGNRPRPADPPPPAEPPPSPAAARRLRIEVTEGGRRVVNLQVPINIAGLAGAFVPGLSDEDGQRIRDAIASGLRGPIVDIGTQDGDRVLIVSE